MSVHEPCVELKPPSESEDEPSNGKKPKTEDPLVAANALASFAGPGTEEEGERSATIGVAPSSQKKHPDKRDEAPESSVHNDDDDTETTVSCASDSAAGAVAAAAAAAASGAIQKAMMAVKQEQHVLAEREEAVKRQRSKAARFCAESRARRRLRTMIFDQSTDPATQQLRFAQLQQLQQSQIRNQARCTSTIDSPHPGPTPPVRLASPIGRRSSAAVLHLAAIAAWHYRKPASHPSDGAVRDAPDLSAAQPCSRRVVSLLSRPSEHGSTLPAAARLSRVEPCRLWANADRHSADANAPRARTHGLSSSERVP